MPDVFMLTLASALDALEPLKGPRAGWVRIRLIVV